MDMEVDFCDQFYDCEEEEMEEVLYTQAPNVKNFSCNKKKYIPCLYNTYR